MILLLPYGSTFATLPSHIPFSSYSDLFRYYSTFRRHTRILDEEQEWVGVGTDKVLQALLSSSSLLQLAERVLSLLQARSLPTEAAAPSDPTTSGAHQCAPHQCTAPPALLLPRVELLTCCDPNQLLYLTISIVSEEGHPNLCTVETVLY